MRQKEHILNIRMGGVSMSENNVVRLPALSIDRNLLLLKKAKESFWIFKKRKDKYYHWNNKY